MAFLTSCMVLLTPFTPAYGHDISGYLNQYFLPVDAQVTGVGGVVFGVLAPVGIVMILFYIALDNVFSGHGREVKALSILFALFTIPSGAYKTISELLIGIFNVAGSTGTTTGPTFYGFQQMELISILAGIGVAAAVLYMAYDTNSIDIEKGAIMASLAGMLTYMALAGQIEPISAVFSLIMIYAGYRIFKEGITSSSRPGMIIGLMGLVFLTWAVRSADFAPDEVQQLVGSFRIFAYIIIFLLIITMIINLIFKGALLGGVFGGGGSGGSSP